jgi:hypothetical protein
MRGQLVSAARTVIVGIALLMVASCSAGHAAPVIRKPAPQVSLTSARQTARFHAEPVLGYRTMERHGGGWGTSHPEAISYEGSPTTTIGLDRWRSWGKQTATAMGVTPVQRPGGGYYRRPARAEVRATRLGFCHGRWAYMSLYVRTAPRPNAPLAHKWSPWGVGDGADICPATLGG